MSKNNELSPRNNARRVAAAAVAFGLATAAVHYGGMDAWLSSLCRGWDLPGDISKAIALGETFGHSLGAAAILYSVWLLAPARRPAIWLAIGLTLTSGVAANALKSLVVRVRPHSVGVIQIGNPSPAGGAAEAVRAADDNPQMALQASGGEKVAASYWDARQRSFPSGHAATAWALAIGLSLVFPRGWLLFGLFAALASLQRVTSGAHFPTDVLAGAALACGLAAALLWWRPLPKLWESSAKSAHLPGDLPHG